jgi:hypothetical protein
MNGKLEKIKKEETRYNPRIYLGGLGPCTSGAADVFERNISPHLRGRRVKLKKKF